MPEEHEPPIPIEIPWKLAATTQKLKEGFPDDTTISLFTYEPTTETLNSDYPEERLIYLKFTVSVSSCHLQRPPFNESALSPLIGGLPVMHLVLDLAVTPEPFEVGGIRPYFHAAAPIRRSMIETGVVGRGFYEGESDALAVGRSASQLHETVGSQVTTKTKESSGGLPGIFNVGKSESETLVDSRRSVDQFQETLNRDASTERKELLTHMTNVTNLLTLLNAKHVGSPFLRFSLSPRPLTYLSVDPGDPNLWYRELLHRRSSGIEGIQEFFAVVAVPRNTKFCIQALLRQICVLDDPPPAQPLFPDGALTPWEMVYIRVYLHRHFPVGTPLDHLDVDLTKQLPVWLDPIQPFVRSWSFHLPHVVNALVSAPNLFGGGGLFELVYKSTYEVRLSMMRDNYFEELARSPLERGTVLTFEKEFRTCLEIKPNGGPSISNTESLDHPVSEIPFDPTISFNPPPDPNREILRPQFDPVETSARWNLLESQLVDQVGHHNKNANRPVSLDSPKIIQIYLRIWAKLNNRDPRNLPMDKLAAILKLNSNQVRKFEEAEVKDLKDLGQVLLAAPESERWNNELGRFLTGLTEKQKCELDLSPISFPISTEDANHICRLVGAALKKEKQKNKSGPYRQK